ncbi:hypothetical protein ACGFWG_07910 [Streptomyces sp. NPDC048405]|uniref:hypothetical protein n=1 Tax=Streptomyces TaxID=1883 RepID=UPI001590C06A|nr:hypothetical protein [Streptomyces sp. NA03103]QKW63335.1 hypothetical protein HUT15_24025 [Streptomyces sp. NA03103]
MKIAKHLLVAAGVLAVAVAGIEFGTAQGGVESPRVESVVDGVPGYAVEDFNYPQADKILEERGIVLKRGDGHIILADCGSQEGLLVVWSRSQESVCFRVTGDSGFLTMEMPAVYAVRGNSYETDVTMTVGEEEKHFEIAKNAWTNVGEAADPEDGDHMLVEITTNK